MARARRATSKAGRNEGRKLFAGFLNTLAAASTLASVIQPAVAVVREGRRFLGGDAAAAFLFVLLGLMLHIAAQVVVRRLED